MNIVCQSLHITDIGGMCEIALTLRLLSGNGSTSITTPQQPVTPPQFSLLITFCSGVIITQQILNICSLSDKIL